MTVLALVQYARWHWAELDGILWKVRGARIHTASASELMAYTYAEFIARFPDTESRNRAEAWLRGKLGAKGGYIIDDPALPESMQGKEAPSWWTPDHDPFKNQQRVPG